MATPIFRIQETEGCIELTASGELTDSNESFFRLNLLKLLMIGKSKSYKLNLRLVETMDASCIQLVHILRRQLEAVNATLVVDMPENAGTHAFMINADSSQKKYNYDLS